MTEELLEIEGVVGESLYEEVMFKLQLVVRRGGSRL